MLFIFIILSLLNRNSLFHTIRPGNWTSGLRKTAVVLSFFLFISGSAYASANSFVPDRKAAEKFGEVLVQRSERQDKAASHS